MAKRFVFQDLYSEVLESDTAWEASPETALLFQEEVREMEQRLCTYLEVEHCVAVSSAEEGLLVSLLAADIGKGDHVLCSGFAPKFVSDAILAAGAVPMLVDINPNTMNMDPFCLEYVLGKCMRTERLLPKALVATDMFGLPCNYPALLEICRKHDIVLLEDMSQSMGAQIDDIRAGNFARFSVTSFWVDSQLDQEDGGAVLCHTMEDEFRVREVLEQTRTENCSSLGIRQVSIDYVQAIYGAEKIDECQKHLEQRGRVAAVYRRRLGEHLRIQQVVSPYISAYTRFVVALPQPERMEEILLKLEQQEVLCSRFIAEEGPVDEWDRVMLVNVREARNRLIALPIAPYLSDRIADQICDMVLDVLAQ